MVLVCWATTLKTNQTGSRQTKQDQGKPSKIKTNQAGSRTLAGR
jgi:hypothetical protein